MSYAQTLHRTKTDPLVGDTPSTTAIPTGAYQQPDAPQLVVTFEQATNAAPTTQLADSTTVADITVLMGTDNCISHDVTTSYRILYPLVLDVPPGWYVYVYMSALSSANGSTDRVNIFVQPYRQGS